MSHFYGDMQGNRGEVTRCGSKGSGIDAHIRGWDFGVRVRMYHRGDGKDVAIVSLTGGSNGRGVDSVLGAFVIDDLRRPPIVSRLG